MRLPKRVARTLTRETRFNVCTFINEVSGVADTKDFKDRKEAYRYFRLMSQMGNVHTVCLDQRDESKDMLITTLVWHYNPSQFRKVPERKRSIHLFSKALMDLIMYDNKPVIRNII